MTHDIVWIQIVLDQWGAWARQTDRLGYSRPPIGTIIRSRREQTASHTSLSGGIRIDDDNAMAVDRAVGSLPGVLSTAIKMRYVDNLSDVQAAPRLASYVGRRRLSVSTFRRRMAIAHHRLIGLLTH